MKLIIADDNAKIRKLIRILVRKSFEQIYECLDGDEVVTCYMENKPDWVFLDIQMEHMDGISAAKLLISQFPTARIVIISNFDNLELRKVSEEIGVKYYLNKDELFRINSIIKQFN